MKQSYVGFKDPDGNPSPPLPIQQEAFNLRRNYRHVLNAGSFGTGKSEWLCQNIVNDAIRYPGNEILTGRKKLDWFKSSTLPILMDAIPESALLKHDRVNHDIYIKTAGKPSCIHYRQLDASRDAIKQINSMNLGLFAPDQIEEIDEEVFIATEGRLRRPRTPRQSVSACNPAGHNWVWQYWINGKGGELYGHVEGRMWQKDVPPPTCQADVHLGTSDNPFLPWDYIASLINGYPENWLDRYVYCGWDNFEGLVYPEWDSKIHLVKPFPVPKWWNHYLALDHGHRNPTAVGWWVTSPDGDVYLINTHYQAGQWVEYHSEVIKAKTKQLGLTMRDFKAMPADPSIFDEHAEATIGDEYYDNGIDWEKANNDISGGINRVASYLKPNPELKNSKFPDGKPRLFVFDVPENRPFVDEIGAYTWADLSVRSYNKNLPEKPNKKDDHMMDMTRYMINWLEDSKKPVKKKKEDYFGVFRRRPKTSYMGV
jgi:hypothetical protein